MIIKNVSSFIHEGIFAALITLITFLFGGMDKSLMILLLVMFTDLITGVVKGAKNHELSSEKCFEGIAKKLFILIYVMLAHLLDMLLDTTYVRIAVCWLYIVNDIISIIENGAQFGVKVPKPILKALEVMQDDEDTGNNYQKL